MGHSYIKTTVGVTILVLSHRRLKLYICTKFSENISKGFQSY